MRKFDAEDESDVKDLARLGAPAWMVEALALNPEYVWWGPHEDYMSESSGWRKPIFVEDWTGVLTLDELNECVNFYFEINRDRKKCEACDGSGLNPATKQISDDWYDFAETGRRWDKAITQDEVQALVDGGRLFDFVRVYVDGKGWVKKDPFVVPTAEEVNAWSRGRGLGHDAINKWICVETRAKRLGVYGHCSECDHHGDIFTAPEAHLTLVLWIIHPRKGACRGMEIKRIEQDELPLVKGWLRGAALRNAERFGKIA